MHLSSNSSSSSSSSTHVQLQTWQQQLMHGCTTADLAAAAEGNYDVIASYCRAVQHFLSSAGLPMRANAAFLMHVWVEWVGILWQHMEPSVAM